MQIIDDENYHYILDTDGKTPIVEHNIIKWVLWIAKNQNKRRVAFNKIGKTEVSTVFLGKNHNFSGGAPLLFETLIRGGHFDGDIDRYSTFDDAMKGHNDAVLKVKALRAPFWAFWKKWFSKYKGV